MLTLPMPFPLRPSPIILFLGGMRILSEGAEFSPYDGEAVGERLSEAWRLFSLSLQSGESATLGQVFSGPALTRAQSAAAAAPTNGVHMVTLALAHGLDFITWIILCCRLRRKRASRDSAWLRGPCTITALAWIKP